MSVANRNGASALVNAGISGMRAASAPLLRVAAHRNPLEGNKDTKDGAFHSLLASANQEFSRLMRDVRRERQGEFPWSADSWQSGGLLMRAIRCAAKHYILQAELRNIALKDELTGLYNRRGFYALAERQLKIGERSGRGMLLFFIDLDGLKKINDSLGHSEGDRTLNRTAEALKKTFRDSDIVARLGGDEFAVLAVEASGHSEATILARLQRYLRRLANGRDAGSCISLSVGVARFDCSKPASIAKLMAQADQAMYEQKWARRKLSSIP